MARGLAARGPRPKPGTIGGGAQSPPCPPPSARAARPAGTWRRGRRSCRARPALPRRARKPAPVQAPRRHEGGLGVSRGQPRAAESPRPRGASCPRGRTQSPRGEREGGAPGPFAPQLLRPGARSGAHKLSGPPPPAHAAPPARRFLVGAHPPGPRPAPCAAAAAALCSGGALTLAPREKLCPHGGRAPRLAPAAPGTAGGLVRSLPRAIVCAGQAPPGSGPPPPRAPSGPRARQDGRPTPAPNGPRPTRPVAPAPARPPRRSAAAPLGAQQVSRAGGGAGALTAAAATIFASLRATPARGPQADGVRRGRPGRARGCVEGRGRRGDRPHPSASPQGAKWREGAGRGGGGSTSKDHVGE